MIYRSRALIGIKLVQHRLHSGGICVCGSSLEDNYVDCYVCTDDADGEDDNGEDDDADGKNVSEKESGD